MHGTPNISVVGQSAQSPDNQFGELLDIHHANPELAIRTIERTLDTITGWPELNEFKHTTIPR